MNEYAGPVVGAPQSRPVGFKLPLSQPRLSYGLLSLNVLVWLAMGVVGFQRGLGLGGSQSTLILIQFGAQVNSLIVGGEYWRLLTSMALHAGLLHLGFNSWALYILGRDVERLYGHGRFLLIYLLSGLGGSLAYFLLGNNGPSVGASGAIFGLVGTEMVFLYIHRRTFGHLGQQHLRSLMMITVVNLVIGFTVPGINNIAHIGGLLSGGVLGWLLVPQYAVPPVVTIGEDGTIKLIDRNSLRRRLPALALMLAVLAAMGLAGTIRWSNDPVVLLSQAVDLLEHEDYEAAAAKLRPLADRRPNDGVILFYLGVAEANLGHAEVARQAWERSAELEPDIPDTHWNLALVYKEMGRVADAIAELHAFIRLSTSAQDRARAEALIQKLSP